MPDIAGELAHLSPLLSYGLLFAIVALESSGLPVPGETSIAAASLLAARGNLSLPIVIVVASTGAIVGDNVGYFVGRRFGRRAVLAGNIFHDRRERLLDEADAVFRAHGGKMVFFARWLPVLRFFGGPLAGISHMPWRRFFVANAAGGILWSTSVSLIVYYTGRQAGLTGLALVAAVLAVGAVIGHIAWRRLQNTPTSGAGEG
jgi:membrane protein DedA with SNARE-associated domain